MTVPLWAWAAFGGFVVALLALDVFVLRRQARAVPLREACVWSAVWIAAALAFGGLLWALAGGGTAQDYMAAYLIEKTLSVDNIFLFAAIFGAFAIPARYQHRVLMFGIVGALVMRGAFIAAGIALIDAIHPISYLFGAVLLVAAVSMLRGDHGQQSGTPRVVRVIRRFLPVADRLHGQRFTVRSGGRVLATPLLLALVAIETADVIFAVDSIPAVLAVTTDPFVVYTSNVFALLGMRALYFLLAGAAARLRYLRHGLAVILAGVAVKFLLADVWHFPTWSAPAFIVAVLATIAAASVRRLAMPHPQVSLRVGACVPFRVDLHEVQRAGDDVAAGLREGHTRPLLPLGDGACDDHRSRCGSQDDGPDALVGADPRVDVGAVRPRPPGVVRHRRQRVPGLVHRPHRGDHPVKPGRLGTRAKRGQYRTAEACPLLVRAHGRRQHAQRVGHRALGVSLDPAGERAIVAFRQVLEAFVPPQGDPPAPGDNLAARQDPHVVAREPLRRLADELVADLVMEDEFRPPGQ